MMARSAKCSNQRPDTLMQDRTSPNSKKFSCNARPDHTLGHNQTSSYALRYVRFSIGAGWCQALSDCSVDPSFDVARRDPRFSSGSALWPSHDGIRRMRRTNLTTRPCRKTYGRHQDSKRTRLIHRPCGDIAPPGRRNSVFSYRYYAQLRHDMMSVTSVH